MSTLRIVYICLDFIYFNIRVMEGIEEIQMAPLLKKSVLKLLFLFGGETFHFII